MVAASCSTGWKATVADLARHLRRQRTLLIIALGSKL